MFAELSTQKHFQPLEGEEVVFKAEQVARYTHQPMQSCHSLLREIGGQFAAGDILLTNYQLIWRAHSEIYVHVRPLAMLAVL